MPDGGSVDRHAHGGRHRLKVSSLGVFLPVNIVCKVVITDVDCAKLRCVVACSEHSETILP
eukprot:5231318-Prymnesium_polylepis.1